MKNIDGIKRTLAAHRKELQQKFNVEQIAIFGSFARGDMTASSDVDILVGLSKPLGWEIVDLSEYLQDLLGMKVDLVTRGAVLRKKILWQSIQKDLVNV